MINVKLSDVYNAPCEAYLGNKFNNLVLVTLHTNEGFIDVLFYGQGELLTPAVIDDTVSKINAFFNKRFTLSTLDSNSCFIHRH